MIGLDGGNIRRGEVFCVPVDFKVTIGGGRREVEVV
jgi:hypothetical protein